MWMTRIRQRTLSAEARRGNPEAHGEPHGGSSFPALLESLYSGRRNHDRHMPPCVNVIPTSPLYPVYSSPINPVDTSALLRASSARLCAQPGFKGNGYPLD